MAGISIGIEPGEFADLSARLERAVEDIQAAALEAATATASWLQGRVANELTAETGIAQALFLRRVKRYVKTGLDARGRVFVGLFRPEASATNLVTLAQEATGARGGKYFFEGAFVATMPNGFTGIFRRNGRFGRRGQANLERISLQHIELPSAQQLIARHELPAEVYFRREFNRRLAGALA